MSWLKKLKKSDNPSQHPPPLNTSPQIGAEPSSINAGPNRGTRPGGANSRTTSGGNSGAESRRRGGTIQRGVATSVNNTKEPTQESRTLKSVLATVSAIYVHCEDTAPVANMVEDLISRIIALEELFVTPAGDVAEQKRRRELIRKLRRIEVAFQSLYRKPQPQQLQGGSGDISDLLEDLREAIFDYRGAQQREMYARVISSDEAAVLNSLPYARKADVWCGGCLKGTRRAILDEIELWTRNPSGPPVYWVNGLARTGKTAIIQTIVERTFADGQLGALFYCSRDSKDLSNLRLIFPTLAVQLAYKYANFRSFIIPLVQSNPGIAYESLENQMQKLIVQPLQEFNISTVVIIDGLDECKDREPTSAILSVLAQFVSEIPKVKFLITSRPETHIREGFRLPLLAEVTEVFVLHEVEKSQVDNDVRLFFRRGILQVVGSYPDYFCSRPTEAELDVLCTQAGGSFAYAVAAAKFINDWSSDSRRRLDLLLQPPGSNSLETMINLNKDRTLDRFYALILQGAFGGGYDPDNTPKIRSVLGAVVLATEPLSPSTIAILLGLDVYDVFCLLSLARPLLAPQKDIHIPVSPLYKPFLGFIVDPERCTDRKFHVSPSNHHPQLLMGCLNLMVRTLEENMCKLPDGSANSDIGDLKQRIEQHIDPALAYACKSWHLHLVDRYTTSVDAPGITLAIHSFLETKFLFWLEVLSVLGVVRNAVNALQAVVDWLEESPTLDLVNECSHFVTSYFEIISASCLHIYHSALIFTPKSLIVRKLYESHARPFTRVVYGLPGPWNLATLATGCPFRIDLIVWSPCSRYFAISPYKPVTVAILDSKILRQLQHLEFSPKTPSRPLTFIFSPDSRMLTCSCASPLDEEMSIVSWDVKTGRIVSAIEHRGRKAFLRWKPFITYSTDGGKVGILYRYRNFAVISIYNVVSGTYLYNVPHGVHSDPGGLRFYDMWTHGGSLRFVTAEPTTITVREVGFLSSSTPREVAILPVPENVHHTDVFKPNLNCPDVTTCARFLPTSRQLALTRFVGPAPQILVWDPKDTEPQFLDTDSRFRSPLTLSADGRFLACSSIEPEVYLWRESSPGYMLAAKLPSTTQHPGSLLSPNGESIVVYDGSSIRLWPTNAFTTAIATVTTTTSPTASIPSISTRPQQTENFVLEFHPVKQLAAFARRKGSKVTILDLKSGLPQLTINTGVEVLGIRVIEDTIVVVSDGRVATWKLPDGNCLPGTVMAPQDRTQTIYLNDKWQNSAIAASISFDLSHVAFTTQGIFKEKRRLYVYSASTGRRVGYALVEGNTPWFAPDRLDIWCVVGDKAEVWTVGQKGLYESTHSREVDGEPLKLPWGPPCGYQVTKYGWILGPGGKRLFLLPLPLRSDAVGQMWKEQYVALLHGSLSEPVILELEL